MRRATLAALAVLAALLPASAATYSSPEAALKALYAAYMADTGADGEIPDAQDYFSDHLKTLYTAEEESADGVGALDFDPVVVGQDWSLSKLEIAKAKIDGDTAHATVRFDNFDAPQILDYTLVRDAGGWHIEDIRSLKPGEEWTLSAILKGR